MNATHAQMPVDLVFPPHVPFSWTLRWAQTHRKEQDTVTRQGYRIAGYAASDADLAAAVAFCETYDATLELD